MALAHSPSIVTSGLLIAYDMDNPARSWKGAPTTNLVDQTMSIYNNVPGDVSVTLEATSERYLGAVVYKETITPLTATGVSYLTNGNNPGIGIVYNGGGGTANRYTGFAVCYRPEVPMFSTPLYSNYSNIPGYGAGSLGSNRSVSQGNGWFRGEVIWFDTVTRTDGKYWAINPAGAAVNVPIIISWAAPFKEDRNSSNLVSPYVIGTRANTQSLLDLTSTNTLTTNNLTYNSDNTFNFAGGDETSTVTVPLSTAFNKITGTIGMWVNPTSYSGSNGLFVNRDNNTANATDWFWIGSYDSASVFYFRLGDGSSCCNNDLTLSNWASFCPTNTWTYVTCSWLGGGESCIYTNGVLRTSRTISSIPATNPSSTGRIGLGHSGPGSWNGKISTTQIYNRQLSEAEIIQNFNAYRGRYGI